mmetsp:Transcript_6971/g.8397  ORF Transcript_6971/g.8397 Transcript_6971/m.8397 type:complete len:260 (+) Transcript_6971:721-1500(+)
MILSARSIKLSMTRTLSLILAPPTIAVSGFSTLSSSRTWEKASSSLATRRPATQGILPAMPTVDEWARCAVPNASFTKMSPSFASEARKVATSSSVALNFSHFSPLDGAFFSHFAPGHPSSCLMPLPSSSACQRRFSRTMMEPGTGSAHDASTSAPTQLERNVTGFSRSSPSLSATGFSVIDCCGHPSGRPRCDMSTTDLAPFPSAISMVGNAPTIRWAFVMLPSLSCGTLKSTRISTRLPTTSTSAIVFLLSFIGARA